MTSVRFTRRALARLRLIGEWIAADNLAAAQSVTNRIVEAAKLLQSHPAMGRTGRVTGTRELVLADISYIIVYRVRPVEVEILTILHTSQRRPKTF